MLSAFAWARNAEYGTSTELLGADPKNARRFQTSRAAKTAHQTRPGRPPLGGLVGDAPGRGAWGPGGDGRLTATLDPGLPGRLRCRLRVRLERPRMIVRSSG